jgi:hypothetical protein
MYGPNLVISSNGQWNFLLVAQSGGKEARYTPKSDARLCINGFPHLVLEIISDAAQSDMNRMLLQAACLARLGNAMKGDPASGPFIFSAIYIDNQLFARWLLVYQPQASDPSVGLILPQAVRYLRLGR